MHSPWSRRPIVLTVVVAGWFALAQACGSSSLPASSAEPNGTAAEPASPAVGGAGYGGAAYGTNPYGGLIDPDDEPTGRFGFGRGGVGAGGEPTGHGSFDAGATP